MNILLKYMKTLSDSQFKIEILQTIEKILFGLGSAGQSIHKEVYKQLKPIASQERALAVRCAAIKCLCEMSKHSAFLYAPSSSSSSSTSLGGAAGGGGGSMSSSGSGTSGPGGDLSSTAVIDVATQVCNELAANVQLGFKAFDNSNYDVRVCVSAYLAQLIYYSLMQLQQQQFVLQQQQQMANVLASGTKFYLNLILVVFYSIWSHFQDF